MRTSEGFECTALDIFPGERQECAGCGKKPERRIMCDVCQDDFCAKCVTTVEWPGELAAYSSERRYVTVCYDCAEHIEEIVL